jgi:C1A family cysteine protease
VNFKDNRAKTEDNYYKTDYCNMLIGNGNYTMIKGDFEFNGTLPSRYDLRDYGWVSPVKNQKSSGNCWAFTAISALESSILKATNQIYDFSEENLKNVMTYYSDYGWALVPNKGGYDDMGVAYLISWLGAVNEGFESYDVNTALSPVLNSSIHVQNVVYLTRNNYTDNDAIKEAIMKYGGVAAGMYYSSYYLKGNSYYYSGSSGQNHAVTVVGWDDNYSKTNFKTTPEGDGAWICKNSWGESWGDKGYFYISYYDTKCVRVGPYDKSTYALVLNDTMHYDKNYQYDIIGITDYLITGKDTIWYENIFNATDNEFLTAFSTYFNTTTNWTAQIYVNNDLKVVKNGTSDAGYYTFDLDDPIPLNIGDTFKIVIKISTDKYASFPISERVRFNRVLYKEGVSFFSLDGENWTDLYNYKYNASEFGHNYESQVACIKAFTSFVHNTTISISDAGVIPVDELVNLTAVVKDPYGNKINSGEVNFTIGSESYTVPIIDYTATLTMEFNSTGIYTVNAEYLGNTFYYNSFTSKKINVDFTDLNLTLIVSNAYYGEDILIYNTLISNGIEIDDYINVTINNKTYSFKSNSLTSLKEALNPNEYTAYAAYYNITTSDTFNVYKILVSIMLDIENIGIDGVNISVMLSEPLNTSVNVSVNSVVYPLITRNGVANLVLSELYYGNYTVNAIVVSDYYESSTACGNFSINYIKTTLIANNVTLYYHDGTRFYVTLLDSKNNLLVNESVIFSINGVNYTKYTDETGECSFPLNLNSASYPVTLTYLGKGKYLPTNFTGNVLIKPTIISSDITKIFRNATPFTATILDNKGNIARNTTVSININGVFYYKVSDNNGVVRLNLNLAQGTYILTTTNLLTGEKAANTVTIIPSIVENYDLTKYYKNDSKYSVRILGDDGNPLANAEVSFNINGVFYKRTTDANGYASLSINLNPDKYIITAEYNGCRVSNVIEVLSVLESNDLNMKYHDGSKFKLKVLDGLGNPNPSQKVTFNINGVLYNKETDEYGFAYLTINLQVGKYIITSSYNGLNVANTITITN